MCNAGDTGAVFRHRQLYSSGRDNEAFITPKGVNNAFENWPSVNHGSAFDVDVVAFRFERGRVRHGQLFLVYSDHLTHSHQVDAVTSASTRRPCAGSGHAVLF